MYQETPFGDVGRKSSAGGLWTMGAALVLIGLEDMVQFLRRLVFTGGKGIDTTELLITTGSIAIVLVGAGVISDSSSLFSHRPTSFAKTMTGTSSYLLLLGILGIANGIVVASAVGPFLGAVLVLAATLIHSSKRNLARPLYGAILIALSLSLVLDSGFSASSFFGIAGNVALQDVGVFLAWRPTEVIGIALLGVSMIPRSREVFSRLASGASLAVYSGGVLVAFYQVPGAISRVVVGDPGDLNSFAFSVPLVAAIILLIVGGALAFIGSVVRLSAESGLREI